MALTIIKCPDTFLVSYVFFSAVDTNTSVLHQYNVSYTGVVMEDIANQLLGVKKCSRFTPRHSNNLANEFCCYVNYSSPLS